MYEREALKSSIRGPCERQCASTTRLGLDMTDGSEKRGRFDVCAANGREHKVLLDRRWGCGMHKVKL